MIERLIGRKLRIGEKVFTVFAAEWTQRGPQALLVCPDGTLIGSDLSGATLLAEVEPATAVLQNALNTLKWADNVLRLTAAHSINYRDTLLAHRMTDIITKIEEHIAEQSR